MKRIFCLIPVFCWLLAGPACTKHAPDPGEAELKRIEADISSLTDEKTKLEGKLKAATNPEEHLQTEQEMDLLRSRLDRLSEKVKEVKH